MTIGDVFAGIAVGGGPAGPTPAHDLAATGRTVLLLARAGRIKPCGGAIPPRLIRDFDIPDHLLKARIRSARMIAPSRKAVDMPIDTGGFVGMVDRDGFDEWLRERAVGAGAKRNTGTFQAYARDADGVSIVTWRDKADILHSARTRVVIGADGANSAVARAALPPAGRAP